MALEDTPPPKPAGVNSVGPEQGELGSVTSLLLLGLLPWKGNPREKLLCVGQARQGAAGSLSCPRPFRGYC